MDELIKLITSQLGIDASVANSSVGKLMALLKENVGSELFEQIAGAVPGAESAATQAAQSSEPAAGAGLLGKLTGMASSMLGSKAGGGLEIASALASSGIPTDKLGPLVNLVLEFLKGKLGEETVDQIVGKLPMLKAVLG